MDDEARAIKRGRNPRLPPASQTELFEYIRRELVYIEGIADGIGNNFLKLRVNTIRGNLKDFEEAKDE